MDSKSGERAGKQPFRACLDLALIHHRAAIEKPLSLGTVVPNGTSESVYWSGDRFENDNSRFVGPILRHPRVHSSGRRDGKRHEL